MASPGRCSRSAIAATQTTQIGRRVILRFVFQRRGFFFWPDYDWMIVVGWNPGRATHPPFATEASAGAFLPGIDDPWPGLLVWVRLADS